MLRPGLKHITLSVAFVLACSNALGVKITKEDIQDLAGAQLPGVDVNEAGKYELTVAGKEMIDGCSVYAVDVAPRNPPIFTECENVTSSAVSG